MAIRTVGVKLTADVASYMTNMGRAGAVTKGLSKEMAAASKASHLDSVTQQAAVLGLGLIGVAGAAVKMAADFDKQMSSVSAATMASAGDLERLRAAALKAGADTKYSAIEAAQGIEELAKAGVSTSAILSGGLSGALSLASAGSLDVAEAAETAASAMTQFGLKGSDVPHIADLLAAAAGKAQGSVHDMGFALSQAGLVANQMGLSVEDTTGTLAAFASAGLLGSDAGTSLKTAMLMLAKPSKEAAELMEELGINTYDAQGDFVGITNLSGQLKDQLSGLTQEQRNAALATIFGADAIRAASVLYEQGATGIQGWIDKVNDQGYAAEVAAKKTDNLIGDIERLTGSVQNLAIESGSGANGGLRFLVQMAEKAVDAFASLPPVLSSGITVVAGLTGGALLLGAAWLKSRAATAEMLAELRQVGPNGDRAATALERTRSAAMRAAGAFIALQTASMVVNSMQDQLKPQIDAMAKGLADYGRAGALAGESSRVLGTDLADLQVGFKFLADGDNGRRTAVRNLQGAFETLVPGVEGANTSLSRTKERISATDAALAQLVASGRTDEAKAAFDRLGASLATGGVSMEEFRKQFPQYAGAVEVASGASRTATGAIGGVTGAARTGAGAQAGLSQSMDTAAKAAQNERTALIELQAQIRAQFDPVFALRNAQDKLRDANAQAADAVKTHGKNSVEAKAATRDLAAAALDVADKATILGDTFDGKLTPQMRETLKAAGLTEKQINDVAAEFREAKKKADEYAKKYTASVSLTGAEAVEKRLNRLSVFQQALKKGTIPAGFQGPIKGPDGKYYAAGGWTGPGAKYTEAGIVHADEYVIKKESRNRIEGQHPGLLDEMNATGQLPGYAAGGPVRRWPFATTAAMTRVPSRAEAAGAVTPAFGAWPSGPGAQRGDSGVWRSIVSMIRGTGPMSGSFGNGYRPGDPLWHGSGRAVDWMGYNQDRLAGFLSNKRPLELIHRSASRDYAYTRGRNKGSFNESLMNAHRNHVHIAMAGGGVIQEPVFGLGLRSGASYSFAERGPERVIPQGSPGYTQPALTSAAAQLNPTVLAAAIRSALVGVSVQMDGRTVGYIQGREADLRSR